MIKISIVLIVLVVIITTYTINKVRKKNNSIMSFMQSMDLVGLPVVTFRNGKTKLNFLLDTGSSSSIINSSIVEKLEYGKSNCVRETTGLGTTIKSSTCNMNLYYNGNKYTDTFSVIDMTKVFDRIKQDSGVTIHGILGSRFLEKYKYLIDFNKNIAYIK